MNIKNIHNLNYFTNTWASTHPSIYKEDAVEKPWISSNPVQINGNENLCNQLTDTIL